MIKSKTYHGFDIIGFKDNNGHSCSLQKSSSAEEPKVWLGVDDASPKVLHSDAKSLGVETEKTCGWVDYFIPESVSLNTRMHLTQDSAGELGKLLMKFAETGEIDD